MTNTTNTQNRVIQHTSTTFVQLVTRKLIELASTGAIGQPVLSVYKPFRNLQIRSSITGHTITEMHFVIDDTHHTAYWRLYSGNELVIDRVETNQAIDLTITM